MKRLNSLMEYIVNDDGSVTRINSRVNNSTNNSGSSSSNNGCFWGGIIAIVVGIILWAISGTDSSATYLRVSDENLYISADGSIEEIEVSTDGKWYIDTNVANWGHLTTYSNSIRLRIDRNSSSSSRSDFFIIKSGNYTKRINITQFGDSSPKAEIERIWMDHNTTQNGVRGMKIHIQFTVDNMKGKTIYAYAFFYWGDNVTPLHDQYNNNLSFYGYGTPNYDSSRFEDFCIFVPYSGLNMQSGLGSVELSYDISVRTPSGTELARNNNTQITFNN